MSDREQDRWRELADLLGLPPDDPKQAAAPPVPAAHKESAPWPARAEPDLLEPEPSAEAFLEPAGFDEVIATETHFHEERSPEREPARPREVEPGATDEPSDERPRHGRKRGRRGSRSDGPNRDNRAPRDNAPNMSEPAESLGEPHSKVKAEEGPSEAPEEKRGERSREERGRGDRSRGGRHRQPSETRRGPIEEETPEEEDIVDTEDGERSEPASEEDDDEEIDQLTDLNLPSWTDLIGSLYRPER